MPIVITDTADKLPALLSELFKQRGCFKQLARHDIGDPNSLYNRSIRALRQLTPEELNTEIVFNVIQLLKASIGNPRLGMAMVQSTDGTINPVKQAKAIDLAADIRPASGW